MARREHQGRLVQLDILRGVAILLVLGRHTASSQQLKGWYTLPIKVWYRFGWTGVDLFFVLSGFLIGGLLFNEIRARGRLEVVRFLIRRGFKIWPSYYLYLAFLLVLMAIECGGNLGRATARMAPFFLNYQNYSSGIETRGFQTWSLAVEEHFYLVLPLVVVGLAGKSRRGGEVAEIPGIPALAVALIFGCGAMRLHAQRMTFDWTYQIIPTHLRIDGLFFGVFLSYLASFRPASLRRVTRRRGPLLALGLMLVSPMLVFELESSPWVPTVGLTMLLLGYGCILLAFVATPVGEGWLGRALATRPARLIAVIGAYSYTIYLWHMELGHDPARWLIDQPTMQGLPGLARNATGAVAYVGLAIAGGIGMSVLVERPALALRARLYPSRVEAVPGGGPGGLWSRPAVRTGSGGWAVAGVGGDVRRGGIEVGSESGPA